MSTAHFPFASLFLYPSLSLFLSLPPPVLMLDVSLWEEVPEMLAGPYISVKISMNKLTF